MNFNEKLISLRKSMGLSQEELGAELHVSRQTISKWESAQSYPDFQRLVLLSDYFGLTLDELVRDVDVADVRSKNLSSEKLDSIYNDVGTAKKVHQVVPCHRRRRWASWRLAPCCTLPFTPSMSGDPLHTKKPGPAKGPAFAVYAYVLFTAPRPRWPGRPSGRRRRGGLRRGC